jgi:hypothetical protein
MSGAGGRLPRRAPHPKPDPNVQAILIANVRIVEGYSFNPIECAQHGHRKLLADRLRNGLATPDELRAAADLLEGKFKRLRKAEAYKTLKLKAIAASVLALEEEEWPREAAGRAVQINLGRSRERIYHALGKYEHDPECQAGELITPWPELEYFGTVLTTA